MEKAPIPVCHECREMINPNDAHIAGLAAERDEETGNLYPAPLGVRCFIRSAGSGSALDSSRARWPH